MLSEHREQSENAAARRGKGTGGSSSSLQGVRIFTGDSDILQLPGVTNHHNNDDWVPVIGKHRKLQRKWARPSEIFGQEGTDAWTSDHFYMVTV